MNRKDIALTVGGVIATMALAYLFYKLQQRDAAAAAATAATNAAAADTSGLVATDPNAQYYQEAAYAQSLPSISIPNLGSSVDTSAATAATGITSTGNSSTSATDPDNLISQVIAAYAGNNTSNPNLLPTYTISDPYSAAIASIPTTAAQATAGTATGGNGSSGSNTGNIGIFPGGSPGGVLSYPASMVSDSSVTSHPVTAHPIVTTGT